MLRMHFQSFADLKICAKNNFFYKLSGECSLDSRKLGLLEFNRVDDRKRSFKYLWRYCHHNCWTVCGKCFFCSRVRAVSRHLGVPYRTVWNVLRKILQCFPYKITHNQQLLVVNRCKGPLHWQFLLKLKWLHRGYDRLCRSMRPMSTSAEQWTPISVAFATTPNLPRASTPLTESYSLVWIHRHIHSWTLSSEEGARNGPVIFTVTTQQVQKNALNFWCTPLFVTAVMSWLKYLFAGWNASTHWTLRTAVSSATFY